MQQFIKLHCKAIITRTCIWACKTLFRHCSHTVDRVEFEMEGGIEGGIEKLVRIAKAFACERGECDLQRLVAYLACE